MRRYLGVVTIVVVFFSLSAPTANAASCVQAGGGGESGVYCTVSSFGAVIEGIACTAQLIYCNNGYSDTSWSC